MCCRAFLKYSLFILNLLFSLLGIVIIIGGVVIHFFLDRMDLNLPGFSRYIPYVVIGFGAFVFLVSFCGCCGSVAEINCLLLTYAIIVALLAAFQIYLSVLLLSNENDLRKEVNNTLTDIFMDIENDATFSGLEILLQCCGTYGPASYNSTFGNDLNFNDTYIDLIQQGYLPPSCCENPMESIRCVQADAFQVGCITLIDDQLQQVIFVLGVVLISLIVYQGSIKYFASQKGSVI